MKFYSSPSFKRRFNKLETEKQQSVKEAINKFINLYEIGINPEGLGLKKLRNNLWEIRSSLKDRLLFRINDDIAEFLIVGNHDDIRRYLKS